MHPPPVELIRTHRDRLAHACAATSRPAQFLRRYLGTSLDRVAWNCAALQSLAHGRRWLDVGGFGLEPLMLHAAGIGFAGHVVSYEGDHLGLDANGQLTDTATAMRHAVTVQALDVERAPLPFDDHSLDLVTCFELLEHLKSDPRALLREIRRVLTADGILWLTTPNILCTRACVRLLLGKNPHENPRYHGNPGYGVIHPKEYAAYELAELATGCGLQIVELGSRTFRRQGATERIAGAGLRLLRRLGQAMVPWPHASIDTGDNLVLFARRGGAERGMPLLFES